MARGISLDAHVALNPGHVVGVSDKTLATTVEAILGAVYLDSTKNIDTVRQVMTRFGLMDDTEY